MRIILVDDHELIREGLKKVIAKESDIDVIGEAQNADEMFELLSKNKIDIVILDITLPGRSGLDLISEIKTHYPDTRILILSMHPEDRFAVRALRAGAFGFITKGTASKILIEALRKIADGRKYITPTLAEHLALELDVDHDKPLHENLSNREFEVMRLIAEGKSVSEIAEMLFISVNTVTSYRSRIMEKMKMKTNAEIIRYAIEQNLIT
ncbi:MAG: response regulator transcription factor [Melioribacteraceae bacterium]|jgi:DNA-binding NarL/FixJ family response regulator|nr:response regulator transcription factor [Melioribacteraceae bacterium]RJP59973.1 MAG: DNA-binding response regulator [Ignavibacteriales bacterium]WKZ69762.1 MAG: response regulator transcription factor [Melioribacteraceae bacterium]